MIQEMGIHEAQDIDPRVFLMMADADGTDAGADEDEMDGGDSDGTDAGDEDGTDDSDAEEGDSDGTDGGDADGTDNA